MAACGCFFCFYSSTYFYFSWEIVFKITFFWKRIWWSLSKTVLKSRISSQTWDCDVLGCKKPCGKLLTSEAWSSRTHVNLKPRTWRHGPGHVISWRSRFAGNAEKPQSEATSFPGFSPTCANESNIFALCFGDQGKKEIVGVLGLKVWPVSNLVQQLATTCNRVPQKPWRKSTTVQTDETCNVQQWWELFANDDVSVCTGLNNSLSDIIFVHACF